tara:strand:- start:11513 stop:12100 length:588 start_codon:yes stop_codon:yes gene_type:complete
MVIPGKPNLEIRLLTNDDDRDLDKFCLACKSLGLENNKDAAAIKLDKMQMPYGQYFIGYDTNSECIWNLAGVHHLPEVGNNVWRVLFRGAQLPGYALGTSKDFFSVSHHWRYFLPLQIKFIQAGFPDAEFVVTTNVKNSGAGKSDRLDKVVMPQLQEQGIVELLQSDVELFYTQQNIWKIKLDFLESKLHLLDAQ